MVSSAKISAMRDMLPAGNIILVLIQNQASDILKMYKYNQTNGRSQTLSWLGNSIGDGTAFTSGNLSVEMTYRVCDAVHPGRDEDGVAFMYCLKRREQNSP